MAWQVYHSDRSEYAAEPFFLPCCAAAMGMSASLLFHRINGCLGLVLFTLLGSPLSNYLGEMFYSFSRDVSINIFPFLRLFDVFPPSLNYAPIFAFGQSVLPYRWLTVLFWFMLSLFVISLKTGRETDVFGRLRPFLPCSRLLFSLCRRSRFASCRGERRPSIFYGMCG